MRHLFNIYLRTLLLFSSIALSGYTYAQQLHFIYIQADNKQPFSVALNGKYYSSSSIGYIILPKLTSGTYALAVNFAKNSYPEQQFSVNVADKDYGYALKNFDDKGWGLFNFQTTDVVMNNATAAPQNSSQQNTVTNTSAFGSMLADVVNDKSINTLSTADTVTTTRKKTAVAKNDEVTAKTSFSDTVFAAPDAVANATTQNSNAATTADAVNETVKEDSAPGTPEFNTTGVIKSEEKSGDAGTDLTFIDFNGGHSDTIKAFIPSTANSGAPAHSDTAAIQAKATAADTAKGKVVNNPFFTQGNSTGTQTAEPAAASNNSEVVNNTGTATTPPALVNSTCSNMVSDGDLSKLKKRIVSQTDQDAVLQAVKKSLKNKCISTEQVKDLGNLFLNDDNRYGFYDAVYPFVYDYGSYASLQNTLIDPYYKSRFKALLR